VRRIRPRGEVMLAWNNSIDNQTDSQKLTEFGVKKIPLSITGVF